MAVLPPGFRSPGSLGFFSRLGSVDGGLLLFLLLSPRRFANMVTRSSRTSRATLSAGDIFFSLAISSFADCMLASMLMFSTVIQPPVFVITHYNTGF
jgi:hypothetical protein